VLLNLVAGIGGEPRKKKQGNEEGREMKRKRRGRNKGRYGRDCGTCCQVSRESDGPDCITI